jgi:hypothetical protein
MKFLQYIISKFPKCGGICCMDICVMSELSLDFDFREKS